MSNSGITREQKINILADQINAAPFKSERYLNLRKKADELIRKEEIPSAPKRLSYGDYTRTAAWQQLRKYALKRDGYRCAMCGKENHCRVVHINQPNDYSEDTIDNLLTLCDNCRAEMKITK